MQSPRLAGHGRNVDLFSRAEIEQTIVSRFLVTATQHAERLAIQTENFRWTYRQLNDIVDQLAELIIRRCGPAPGRLALLFTHDAPMCAAMLATLRAGKTYVPLDPAYPAERLKLIYQDSEPDALLVESLCVDQANLMLDDSAKIVVADTRTLKPGGKVFCEWPEVSPSDMAYILYTSGSTGRPKGVVQSHRNVLHFICEYTRNLGITCHDRLTLLSSYSFDAAVMATYGALLNGASLHPRSIKSSGFAAIGPWLKQQGISIYHSTPTVFRAFLSSQQQGVSFPSVRLVVMGGEPVTKTDVEAFNRHFSHGSTLINGLGPTESTVTLQSFIPHGTEQLTGLVSVGRPVGSTEVLLLDEEAHPTQSEGELAFCSDHLAVGYWRRPDQDAKAFHAHPSHPGRRIYRTGDLARKDAAGLYYFIGRKDLQVKVNGVRIELEEIECVIERLEGVRQCIALAQRDSVGQNSIVAYVLMQKPARSTQALRDELRRVVPDALVPNRLIEVDQFPLTPSNKVDRKALADLYPELETTVVAIDFEPADSVESQLSTLWRDLLGKFPSSPAADFFQVGGDSMMALRLVDGIEQFTGKRVELGDIFSQSTFSDIAEMARSSGRSSLEGGVVVPLTRHAENQGEQLFCICGIQLYQQLANAIGPPVNVSGVFLSVEEEILRGRAVPALQDIANMYLEVILAHQSSGPFRLAGVSYGGMLAYEIARQLKARDHEVAYLGIFDTILPHTIGLGRRLVGHFRLLLRQGPNRFLQRVHHKLLRKAPTARDSTLESRSRDELALVRGEIYTDVLTAYRKTMPDFSGNAWFYRASKRSELEEICFPLHCHWPRYVKGHLTAHEVAGGHVSMLEQPFVEELARIIRIDMAGDLRSSSQEV